MTDSMKFGPEWLRNLSSEGTTSSINSGGTRYHLAEHRYGREEMLALFEQSLKLRPPASMTSFTSLYVEQALNPLTLTPMTDEETRLWSGRGVPPGASRGRGISIERGRGRGRGGSFHSGFNRSNSSYEESSRPFERSQSDRGWSERNGDAGEWGMGSSPRKEYSSNRGSGHTTDNWRRHRSDDIDSNDGWRSSNRNSGMQEKWSSSSSSRTINTNWRDGDTRMDEHSHLSDRQANNRMSWHSSGDGRGSQRRMFDMEDHLPEWATENPSESGGTFDASGAFHGSDDEYIQEKISSLPKSNNSNNSNNSALHKSSSQQNIPHTKKQSPLSNSQSASNLTKKHEEISEEKRENIEKVPFVPQEKEKKNENIEIIKEHTVEKKQSQKPVLLEPSENDVSKKKDLLAEIKQQKTGKPEKLDDEFDHMKEVTNEIVNKLIIDDELPNLVNQIEPPQSLPLVNSNNVGVNVGINVTQMYPTGILPPPPGTLPPPGTEKWYYLDPQGDVQGAFTSQEMTDWFRAGYFNLSLQVKRQCDDFYFTLGDLVTQSLGVPFIGCRFPPLKEPFNVTKAEPTHLDPIHLQRMLNRHPENVRPLNQGSEWNGINTMQQHELVTHHHLMSQTQVVSEVSPFISQLPNTNVNPLMNIINHMQQTKIPVPPTVIEKPPNNVNNQHLDPAQRFIQQMSRIPQSVPVANDVTQEQNSSLQNLLRQIVANQSQPRDVWDLHRQQPYPNQPPVQPQQWQAASGIPQSLWDLHTQNGPSAPSPFVVPNFPQQQIITTSPLIITELSKIEPIKPDDKKIDEEMQKKEKDIKEAVEKEKKKKEQEQLEKIKAQKEAEERRKEEQKKQEAEKKAELEKQKKEEERIRKELEKAKKEAEEKKAREQEEKRKLKEQKKAEEEARKKQEEAKKKQEEERKREEEAKQRKENERREEEAKRQAEVLRRAQQLQKKLQQQQQQQEQLQQQQQRSKVAPWCQTMTESNNLSLAEIQRAEREKRAEQAALLLQQQRAQAASKEFQELAAVEKSIMQLKWASKPVAPKKVKSLAEIQAEEQERVAKQAAEARLAQQQKEKELAATASNVHSSIWSTASQILSWNSNSHTNTGFWEDTPSIQKSSTKSLSKSNSSSTVSSSSPQQPQGNKSNVKVGKSRVKKEEQQVMKLFEKNSGNTDEFTAWCTKTLSALNSDVDIPTFIGFLRDIESPYEVKDYVRQYLGDNSQALYFANQFVERRSRVKDLQRATLQHKDNLYQPAPAITPSAEFQEVKGKGKKTKKSKMTKVDARILGFSVTAAEDRINVGDRDYGDNV